MDWIKALKEEKNNGCVENIPNQTYQTPLTHLMDNPPEMTAAPFLESEKGYPIPTDETEFAADERAAIIDFDGGHDETVQMVMDIFDGTIVEANP